VAFGRFVGDLLTRVQTGQREETPPDLEIEEVDTDGQETAVLDLAPKSRFALRHDFPVTANYMLTIRASGRDRRKPSVINVVVDGVPVPLAIDVSPSSRALSAYTRTIRMSRGVRSLVFTTPPRSRAYVASVEVIGPITPGGAAPLFPCVQLAASPSAESICAAQVVELIASRAFGGAPIGESERHALLAPYRSAADAGADFRTALSRAVQPILMDPRFLYRAGRQGEENDDYAFASRLSYFLWGSLPDDELRRIAARRALRGSPETIRAEIARLLRDPRADALVDAFGGGWLGFGSLRSHAVDARAFPEFSPGLREDMLTETRLYLETFFRENWPIRELMDSDTAFLNAALARHYGVEGVLGAEFRRLQLKGGNRRGLLNQGAILTLTSHSNGTSVVKRGLWVMEKTLCESVGEVPANVPALAESAERGLTLRRQMEKHRNNPVCASCHTKIDPLGFSLENYDAIGRWRTTDDGSLIDPSGALITHGRETAFKNVSGFRDALANDARFPACATRNLMAYALGRSLTDSDEAEIEDILERTKPRGHRIQDVITEIALSRAFRRP
jgi:hypothetical protein